MAVDMGERAGKLGVSTSRFRVGEFWAERGNSGGGTDAFGVEFGRSRGGYGEAEVVGRMAQNLAEKGVEMADAGSLHSRRRCQLLYRKIRSQSQGCPCVTLLELLSL